MARRLAPRWQPFSAAAAAPALRSEAERGAGCGPGQRWRGRGARGRRQGRPVGEGTGARGRLEPAPSPAAVREERGRSAWRAPAIPPFPRHLVPRLAPSQSLAAADKAGLGPLQRSRGPPRHAAASHALPGGLSAQPLGGLRGLRPLSSPRGPSGSPCTPDPRHCPAPAHPGYGKRARQSSGLGTFLARLS